MTLFNCRILLGVTGGIAAYKAVELTRLLTKQGADVQVVMTRAATAFATPLTFQAVSGHPVRHDLLDPSGESAMSHIELARWPELVLIAPATADFIARLRAGMADDLLTSICLATEAPLFVAPAMNQAMWKNAATRENVAAIERRGVAVLGPDWGIQACGESGLGRLLEPESIAEAITRRLNQGRLSGRRILISAGPTREPIDPVRFISNRSSGKMGYAIADAACRAGASVTLVSGPTALSPPAVAELIWIETASEMARVILERAPECDIYIGAAAIADYRPVSPADSKIKKGVDSLSLELTRTEDVLQRLSEVQPRPFLVGFAAETDRLAEHALAKLAAKQLDIIAANWVGGPRGGFDHDENALQVFWPGGEQELPWASKQQIAVELMELIADRYNEKSTDQAAR